MRRPDAAALAALGIAGTLVAGCGGTVPPLRRMADVGRDAYLIFAANGPDRRPDLFALPGGGGEPRQITFTPVVESDPVIGPDGSMLAFLRTEGATDTLPSTVWVMNLVNGAERRLALPKGAARPTALGWRADGRAVYVATAAGDTLQVNAPPADADPAPVPADARAAAESSLATLVGTPAVARAIDCPAGGVCVVAGSDTQRVEPDGRAPARWGPDSLAYFVGDRLVVRPAGPGQSRVLEVQRMPPAPGRVSYFPGVDTTGAPTGGPALRVPFGR